MMDAFFFVLGLLMLLAGGRVLVTAAVAIALRLGVPPLLVGLTIVAWGTSCPELAFNLTAALGGKTDLVLGNVIGANICNLGLVIGISALLSPLLVHATVVKREIPLMLAMFAVFALTVVPSPISTALGRFDPALLLVTFAAYSFYVIRMGLRQREEDRALAQQAAESTEVRTRPVQRSMVALSGILICGLVLLGLGGNFAADAASAIARGLGMDDRVVGLTIVAVGTTLPELITSIIAVRSRQVDLAVGNAVGSCLFNIGATFAICGLIAPATPSAAAVPSLVTMCVLGALLWPMSATFSGTIARLEGAVLLLTKSAFVAFELLRLKGR